MFLESVNWFYKVFLTSDRALAMTKSGGYTTKDFQHVFKKKFHQLVCQLPDDTGFAGIEMLSKYTMLFLGCQSIGLTPERARTVVRALVLTVF